MLMFHRCFRFLLLYFTIFCWCFNTLYEFCSAHTAAVLEFFIHSYRETETARNWNDLFEADTHTSLKPNRWTETNICTYHISCKTELHPNAGRDREREEQFRSNPVLTRANLVSLPATYCPLPAIVMYHVFGWDFVHRCSGRWEFFKIKLTSVAIGSIENVRRTRMQRIPNELHVEFESSWPSTIWTAERCVAICFCVYVE